MLYAIFLTFFSEKVVALRRLVISFKRGCLQVPGLSTIAAVFCGVDLTGVVTAALLTEEDILGAVLGIEGIEIGVTKSRSMCGVRVKACSEPRQSCLRFAHPPGWGQLTDSFLLKTCGVLVSCRFRRCAVAKRERGSVRRFCGRVDDVDGYGRCRSLCVSPEMAGRKTMHQPHGPQQPAESGQSHSG